MKVKATTTKKHKGKLGDSTSENDDRQGTDFSEYSFDEADFQESSPKQAKFSKLSFNTLSKMGGAAIFSSSTSQTNDSNHLYFNLKWYL